MRELPASESTFSLGVSDELENRRIPRRVTREEITLRPLADDDLPLLERIYAGSREAEMRLVAWSTDEKAAFLAQQFTAQHRYYRQCFPAASFCLVYLGETPIGRLYVDRREHEIRVVDIALLPEYQRRGVGSVLFDELMAEAKDLGIPLSIHVEQPNAAKRFYERLGFCRKGAAGLHVLMEWTHKSHAPTCSQVNARAPIYTDRPSGGS